MSDAKDGGAAFPVPALKWDGETMIFCAAESGMSLRDWFAGQALVGLLSPEWSIPVGKKAPGEETLRSTAASRAYAAYFMADAMLRARTGVPK